MNNPFEKKEHIAPIAGVVMGIAAVGVVAYLFLTKAGAAIRKDLAKQFNKLTDASANGSADEHAMDYLNKRSKTPKTDREALLHHQIIH